MHEDNALLARPRAMLQAQYHEHQQLCFCSNTWESVFSTQFVCTCWHAAITYSHVVNEDTWQAHNQFLLMVYLNCGARTDHMPIVTLARFAANVNQWIDSIYIDGVQGRRHACAVQASHKTWVISFRNGILHVLNEIIHPSGPLQTAKKRMSAAISLASGAITHPC